MHAINLHTIKVHTINLFTDFSRSLNLHTINLSTNLSRFLNLNKINLFTNLNQLLNRFHTINRILSCNRSIERLSSYLHIRDNELTRSVKVNKATKSIRVNETTNDMNRIKNNKITMHQIKMHTDLQTKKYNQHKYNDDEYERMTQFFEESSIDTFKNSASKITIEAFYIFMRQYHCFEFVMTVRACKTLCSTPILSSSTAIRVFAFATTIAIKTSTTTTFILTRLKTSTTIIEPVYTFIAQSQCFESVMTVNANNILK